MKFITQKLPKCKDCAVRNAALFGELETDHLDKARALRSSQVQFSAGDFLYHEGETPDKAYTLYEGWVTLFKNLENGDRHILRFALPGDLLCYKTGKNRVLDHSAVAVTDATLCAFPIEGFTNTIAEFPELSFAINSVTNTVMEQCYSALTSIASNPADAKVAYLLLSLYVRECSLKNETPDGIPLPITQEDIADALGLTAIHVNRVLQKLRKLGLIKCKNKVLWIGDQEELAKIARVNLSDIKKLMVAL